MRSRIPVRLACSCCAAFAMWVVAGCGGSPDGLDRKAVGGKVTLDGVPLASGMISFDPVEGSPGAVPAGAVISDGLYSIPVASGPTPGKYKISVRSSSPQGDVSSDEAPGEISTPQKGEREDPIPEKYNAKSILTIEIPSSGSEPIDVEMDSR